MSRRRYKPRRSDLPKILHKREHLLRQAIRLLERMFPPKTGLVIFAFDFGKTGHMSYVSNAKREDMIVALEEEIERLKMGTDDTAGRGEA